MTDQDVQAAVRAEVGRIVGDLVQALQQRGVPVPVMPGPASAAAVEALQARVDQLARQRTALVRLCQQMLDRCGPATLVAGQYVVFVESVDVVAEWRDQLAEASAAGQPDRPPD
ncbi:hypothetical protein EDC02_6324 [Micromonospora sp. Llam0]|uniref:hypothetical protein n=1 Tax=Micromonospora sp. Llam0 TaxID=2485143 RepID=UPI000FAC4E72|nr:hypothetical protein [Micromonospora sp. Llam0]ROO51446.1 hypothetical protein EDC02_6324 [Micromonospora sp. Llam0]